MANQLHHMHFSKESQLIFAANSALWKHGPQLGYTSVSLMNVMSRADYIALLEDVAGHKICASCWANMFEPWLDRLGDFQYILDYVLIPLIPIYIVS